MKTTLIPKLLENYVFLRFMYAILVLTEWNIALCSLTCLEDNVESLSHFFVV